MKKFYKLAVAGLAIALAAPTVYADPTTAAPTPPEFAKSKVISVFSDSFTSTGFDFGDWSSGTVYAAETIDGNNIAKFVTNANAYFGLQNFSANASAMEYLHIDIYCDNAASLRVVPITGGPEVGQTVNLTAGEWTSADLDLATFTKGGANMANVYQIKIDQIPSQTIWIDNIYFYSTSTDVDTEAPTGLTATLKSASYASVTLTCKATDNSGAVTFIATDGNGYTKQLGASSDTDTDFTLDGLTPGTAYTFSIKAVDADDNESEAVTVSATTKAFPTPAPTPTVAATNVVSIYSDAYTPGASLSIGDWGQTTSATEVQLADGDNAYLCEKFNYLGFQMNNNNAVAGMTDMTKLHVDVYSENMTSFEITPVWGGEKLVACTPIMNDGWNSFDIDLSEYTGINKDNVYQIKFVAQPSSTATIFIDNVYFYKEAATEDTEAPVWTSDPALASVTSDTAVITLAATDNSGNAVVTISGDNDFATVTKSITADGSAQTVTLEGLAAETTYNLTFALSDAGGNEATETKTLAVTTSEASSLQTLYIRKTFTADDWKVNGADNTFAPAGDVLITITPDNKVKFTVTFAEDVNDQVDNAQIIFHQQGAMWLKKNDNGQWETEESELTVDRSGTYNFHGNFVCKDGKGNSELFGANVPSFVPESGSTSGVKAVESTNAKVVAANGVIRVSGARSIAVYNVTGQQVYRAQAAEAEITLSRGIYVVVTDGKATKVML